LELGCHMETGIKTEEGAFLSHLSFFGPFILGDHGLGWPDLCQ
jgi:hypothetical protein